MRTIASAAAVLALALLLTGCTAGILYTIRGCRSRATFIPPRQQGARR